MLANNLANATTSGYKADREFYSLFVGADASLSAQDPLSEKSPVIEKQWTDFSQGLLETTGSPTDLAFSGTGFLTVKGPDRNLYIRGGSFQISATGLLTTKEGYPLLDIQGKPVTLQPGAFNVTRNGSVQQNGAELARLAVGQFPDPMTLTKQGGTYFRTVDEKAKPAPGGPFELHQGKLESANVGQAESAVRLVGIMRQFEMLQKAVSISTDMNRKAIEEVARVG